jgi:hypothetical protein
MRFRVGQVATPACVEEVGEVAEGEAGGQEGEAAGEAGRLVTAVGPTPSRGCADAHVLSLLAAVRDAGAAFGVDSALLARQLGWPAEVVAERLADARARLLVWGVRVGGRPGPCFEDIELTVQGRRLLRDAGHATPRG